MTVEAEIEDGAGEAKPGNKRRFILIAAAALGVVVLGAGSYLFLTSGKSAPAPAEVAHAQSFIFNLPTMTINLNSEGEGQQFMKLTVALEVADKATMDEIQPRLAKVIDAFQVYLRELRRSDLEGSAGIYRLKEELMRRVNVAIFPSRVESILFKEILVQ